MRKATKVLFIISEVFCFVGIAVFLALGIVCLYYSGHPEEVLTILTKSGMTGITLETVKNTQCVRLLVDGIILLIASVFSIPAGILVVHCRKKFVAGCTKKEMKAKAIWLIVLGALSCELPIVPAIFMLAMNESNFKD
jgi:hypothetical protein